MSINHRVLKCSNGEVLIDDEDYGILSRYSWSITQGYAIASYQIKDKRHAVSMHRLLTGLSNNHVDHINGNTLDNRKANLRLCSRSQNMVNFKRKNTSTGYRGVTLVNGAKKYRENPHWEKTYTARIVVNKKKINLGTFADPIRAAKAYDEAAIKYHGEFAQVNFPVQPPGIEPIRKETAEDLLREHMEKWGGVEMADHDWIIRAKKVLGIT